MKKTKNVLSIITAVIFSILVSSCDGVLLDGITYIDYPIYSVHPVQSVPSHHIPPRQVPPKRFEPRQGIPYNNIPSRIQRSGPRGAVQSGRGFNRR